MLNCNLYLRSIRSKGAQEIILAIYCFVLFLKKKNKTVFFFFCLLLDQRLGSRKCTWYMLSIKKEKRKLFQLAALPIQMNWKGTKSMIAFSLCCVYFDVCGH